MKLCYICDQYRTLDDGARIGTGPASMWICTTCQHTLRGGEDHAI